MPESTPAAAAPLRGPGRLWRWLWACAAGLLFFACLTAMAGSYRASAISASPSDDDTSAANAATIRLYVLSLALAVLGLLAIDQALPAARSWAPRENPRMGPVEWWMVLAVMVLAVGVRVVDLEDHPRMLHGDELHIGLEARQWLDDDPRDPGWFGTGWYFLPRLGFYYATIPMYVFGPTLLALRVRVVLLGLATLIAAFFLLRNLFGKHVAHIGLLLMACCHWHIHLSRGGFHYGDAVFFSVCAVLAFYYAMATGRIGLFGLAGIISGLGWQSYYAIRIVPILVTAWLATWLLSQGSWSWRRVSGLGVFVALGVIATGPLIQTYILDPGSYGSRTREVLLFSELNIEHNQAGFDSHNAVDLLRNQVIRIIGLPFVGADSAVQYAFHPPFVVPLLWPAFVAGLVLCVICIRQPGCQLLILWTGGLVAVGTLTIDAPFSPRLAAGSILLPAFSALAIGRLMQLFTRGRVLRAGYRPVVFMGTVYALAAGLWDVQRYLVEHRYYSPCNEIDLYTRIFSKSPRPFRIVLSKEFEERADNPTFLFMIPELTVVNQPQDRTLEDVLVENTVVDQRTAVVTKLDVIDSAMWERLAAEHNIKRLRKEAIWVTPHGRQSFEYWYVTKMPADGSMTPFRD